MRTGAAQLAGEGAAPVDQPPEQPEARAAEQRVQHLRVAGKGGQQRAVPQRSPAPSAAEHGAPGSASDRPAARFAGKPAGAQRVGDALPGPRLEQAGRVAGEEHAALGQRRIRGAHAGEMAGLDLRGDARKPQRARRVSRSTSRRSAEWVRGPMTPTVSTSPFGKDPAVGARHRPPVEQHRAGPARVLGGEFALQPEVDLAGLHSDVGTEPARRAVRGDDRPRPHAGCSRARCRVTPPAPGPPGSSSIPVTTAPVRSSAPAATAASRQGRVEIGPVDQTEHRARCPGRGDAAGTCRRG